MKKQFCICFYNIEFFNLPDGNVMYHIEEQPFHKLSESDRDLITWMMNAIFERYKIAFDRLCAIYADRARNKIYYEYSIVRRFIRCNLGNLDEGFFDIDQQGNFCLEEVHCPLRGECPDESIICKPHISSSLTPREMQIFRLIVLGFDAADIANELYISILTVNRHRENIKAKIKVRTVAQMVQYWNNNKFK